MRLHGILIPIGLLVPTFVIAGHAERVGLPFEWNLEYLSIDIKDPYLYDRMVESWSYLLNNYDEVKQDIQKLQERSYIQIQSNMDRLKNIL